MKKSLFLVLSLFFALTVSARNISGYKIGLDPGHGGSDPGAAGGNGAPHEAELCLRAATELKSRLEKDGGQVFLTRTGNYDVGLGARQNRFTVEDAWVSISMHLNAHNGAAYGTESWYCQSSGNSYALAAATNSGLVSCMRDGALGSATAPTRGGGTFNRGVKQTCWTVIYVAVTIPATLTEGLFVDNPSEHNYLKGAGLNSWVNGHLFGIYKFMNGYVNGDIPSTPPAHTLPNYDTTKPNIQRGIIAGAGRDSFWAYAYVTDNVGVTKVEFPTWTTAGDQDDLKWHQGTSGNWTVEGKTYNWRAEIKRSEHKNEYGPYAVHIYANDAAGNRTNISSFTNMPYTFDLTSPTISRQTVVPASLNGYAAFMYATDNKKVTKAQFPTWTNANGQDDLIWHNGTEGKWKVNGQDYNYRYIVKTSEHKNERGGYTTHCYAWDLTENKASSSLSYNFDDNPEIIFDANQKNAWNISTNFGVNAGSGEWSYETTDGHFTTHFKSTSNDSRPWMNSTGDAVKSKQIAWSFWAKLSSGTQTFTDCGFENGLRKSITINTTWQRFSGKGTAGTGAYSALVFNGGAVPNGVTLSVRDYSVKMLEGDITETNNVCHVMGKKGQACPTIAPPTKTRHNFLGYYSEKNGAGTKYYNADGTSAKAMDKSGQVVLYSHWEQRTDPELEVSTTSINIATEEGRSEKREITITGYFLTNNIQLTLNKAAGVPFSISETEIDKAGGKINVIYEPTSVGNHTATLTIASGSHSKTVQLTGSATARPITVNTNDQFSKIPYVILEDETTQCNDANHQTLYDGANSIHGQNVNFLTLGKYKDGNTKNASVSAGLNADRVIWKTKNVTLTLGLPGVSFNKIKFMGVMNNPDNKGSWGGINVNDVKYQTANDPTWRSMPGRDKNPTMWYQDSLKFSRVDNVTKLQVSITAAGANFGISGLCLYGGYGGQILTNTNTPTIYDNPVLYWKAYDINGNLLATDNGLFDSYDKYNANFDGLRNYWRDNKATHKYIRFLMRPQNVDLMTCDLIGGSSDNFEIGDGEHIVLENMGFAPIGIAVRGLGTTEATKRSFFEIVGSGQVTIGANIYGLMEGAHNFISGNGNEPMGLNLQGILGEIRPDITHPIWVKSNGVLHMKTYTGLEKTGFYDRRISGSGTIDNKNIYYAVLDPSGCNLLKNGGFEDHGLWQRACNHSTVGYDCVARTGEKGMLLQGEAAYLETMIESKVNNRPNLVNDHAYYARMYGFQKTQAGDSVAFYFGIAEPKLGITQIREANQWNLYSFRVGSHNPGRNGEQHVRLDFDNGKQNGEMWFDDAMLVDLTEYANRNGLNVTDLTKEVCDTLFSKESNTTGEEKIEIVGNQNLPTIVPPTRNGYIFAGYYDGLYGTGTKYINADGTSARTWDKTTSAMLYAKWIPDRDLELTLDLNGGEFAGETIIKAKYGEIVALPKPVREGYTFTGWSGSGEKWLTRAQAQYGSDMQTIDSVSNGDRYLDVAPTYIFRDCSQENEVTFNGRLNDAIHLGRRHMHTDNLTINVWAWMQNWSEFKDTSGHMRLFSTTEQGGWNMEVYDTDKIAFAVNNGGYIYVKTGKTFAELNNSGNGWHMFTLVIDTDLKLIKGYIDGNFMGETEDKNLTKYNPSNSLILGGESGADRQVAGSPFKGKMKNFGITNRALNTEEVAYIFNNANETRYYFNVDAKLTANWTPNMYTVPLNLDGTIISTEAAEYAHADMTQWQRTEPFNNAKTEFTYNASTKTNTLKTKGVDGYEILYKKLDVEPNQNYELSLDYSFSGGAFFRANYLPIQILNREPRDSHNEGFELNGSCRMHLYKTTETQTLRFHTNDSAHVWIILNGGYLEDSETIRSITISNLRLRKLTAVGEVYGTLPIPSKEGEIFSGWYTSQNGLPEERVNDSTIVTLPNAHTLYAQWAVCRIGNRDFNSLQNAINFYEPGQTIEMLNNTTENVRVDKTIRLVADGKTMTGDLELAPNATLNLVDEFNLVGKCIIESEVDSEGENIANINGNMTVSNHVVYKVKLNLNDPTNTELYKHWFSIPFDVKMNEITGTDLIDMGNNIIPFGNAWYYVWNVNYFDTEARDRGENAYKPVSDFNATLHAKEGRILQFTPKNYGEVTVEFPSAEATIEINKVDETGKTCTNFATGLATNQNWQLCGQPYFCNTRVVSENNGIQAFAKIVGTDNHFEYFLASENEMLKPYESFFVQYAGTFYYQNPAELSPTSIDKEFYQLTLSNAGNERRMGIIFAENANNNYTMGHDLAPVERDHKMQFYSKAKGNDLIFTELSKSTETVVLGYEVSEGGEMTIGFTQLETVPNDAAVTLEDKNNNTFTNLRENHYTFNTESGVFDNRFVLHFSKASTDVNISDNSLIVVYKNGNLLEIKNIKEGANISLFDVTGKLLGTQTATSNSITIGNLVSGFYMLQIDDQPVKMIVR